MDLKQLIRQEAAGIHQYGMKKIFKRGIALIVLVQNVRDHAGHMLRRTGNTGEILQNLRIFLHHLGQVRQTLYRVEGRFQIMDQTLHLSNTAETEHF